ncbi:MAG: DNA polymerase epsilon catalytic subunit [Chrysothrix sp. TS-e1954]|nr:MAG: DNA polymerase epsilon catalytic subunit [Chrysothrix sp. TS-e1954]
MAAIRAGRRPTRVLNGGKFSRGVSRTHTVDAGSLRASEATSQNEKLEATRLSNQIDEAMGFPRYESGKSRVGWLCNMHSTSLEDGKITGGRAGVDYYFIEENGGTFKATVEYDPYFLVAIRRGKEAEVEEWCRRAFEGLIKTIKRIEKEDLQMPNHLLGYRRTLLRLSFANVSDLLAVRKSLLPIAEKNKAKMNALDTYAEVASIDTSFDIFEDGVADQRTGSVLDASDAIVDVREYDVPYHVRVAIDNDIRVGKWYDVTAKHGTITLSCIEERLKRADPVVMAFDIETTKSPLKFPVSSFDQIMMISYMIDGKGFLITNREIVSESIADFDHTPKPEYPGYFVIFNEPDERAVLEKFYAHIKESKPTVIATYNGDFFDWPFIEARSSILGIDMYQEIGFRKNSEDIYQSDYCAHMDAFAWVNRDSYLPQGSRGLKAVTVAKLGYDPDELDPELMTPYASERPQTLAEYSVSDAVATYYLYMKYVHPFIFSLCTIIPLGPDDTLRKGTGTLCEMLLMVQAYQKSIVLPNKHKPPREEFWDGHLLESETYVGGHVESIEAGVFRSDIPTHFTIDTTAIDELLNDLDAALKFFITAEEKKSLDDVENYDEVRDQVRERLLDLKATPHRNEKPLIYHLDVASMYPNIMTTNRLQPDSMIKESDCAACDFNRPGKTCDRRLPWSWRGEYLPAKRDEYKMIRHALENERFPGKHPNSLARTFQDLSIDDQATLVNKRLQDYCKKIYHKIHDAKTIEREAIICQRENPFYVNTVRDFRDRRYDFKGQQKVWKGKTEALKTAGAGSEEIEEAKKMIVLYDSLQLAHKVILNSFYGYVMRKGSRWYSMEMAGVTCLTGARIIQLARQLVERLGRPLELDTDGIWCMLPETFPENFTFKLKTGKKLTLSYPCAMLNHVVHAKFTNHQYQTLTNPQTFKYNTHSDNSIFFEVDGPYRAMILPTSKEEDKNLKKRYAVFNHDGSLAELKGFEVKRRGELKLIKIFQTQIFKYFLEGSTLPETYASVAKVADRWLDVLYQRGAGLNDEELIDLICENKSMTKPLAEYGAQKSTAITTAKRLAEFLGEQMIKDKGLNCKFIIVSRPKNAPVTERAIPVAIFSSEEHVKRFYLRKWLKEEPGDMDPRTVLDWDYYLERLGSVIQKLITIPAALQKLRNPVPRVQHPDWLDKRIRVKDDVFKQKKMTDLFASRVLVDADINTLQNRTTDFEDFGSSKTPKAVLASSAAKISQKRKQLEVASAPANPFASLPTVMPNISEDYKGWLQYQKQKWKLQRQARIRRRQLFGEKRPDADSAVGNLFMNQAELLYSTAWQILQLQPTDIPGEVKAFVLVGHKVHILRIVVPRVFFLNLKGQDLPDIEIDSCQVDKVNHALPNGHPSVHLFKVSMPEIVFINEHSKLAALFNHQSVEGVYETQLPLNVRAMLALGNNCTFDEHQRGVLGKGFAEGFDLSSLTHVPAKQPYLTILPLTQLYLYHVVSSDKEIFALLSTVRREAHIVILRRGQAQQDFPNVDRIYREQLADRLAEAGGEPWQSILDYQQDIHFRISHVSTLRKAHLEIGDAVKKMRNEEAVPMMLILQSSQNRMLSSNIPILGEFPSLSIAVEEEDKQLPSIGWQTFVAKRLVARYLDLGTWLEHLTELARYGNVPLCNLEGDDPRFLIDMSYARRLQKDNVVLWWSDGPRPDHAGYERDDILGTMETVQMPSVNTPGTYSTVCIDVEVKNLLINTILTSSLINDAEGSDSVSFNPGETVDDGNHDGALVLHASNTFTSAGIKILRDMVKSWQTEACNGNKMADMMVSHLVRWISGPDSHLYDRALHYYVQIMAKKAFQQLMTDCRRVGSHVVFASQTRLLLQTTKAEVGNAYAYSEYILKTIKAKPLFLFLDLEVTEYWDYLVWFDAFNYGGQGCTKVVEAENQNLDCIMHWHLQAFLPRSLQSTFNDWIVAFINIMHERKHPKVLVDGTPRRTQLPLQNQDLDDQNPNAVTKILEAELSTPLKKQITQLVRRQRAEMLHPELASDHVFPILPGSYLPLEDSDPVLELVKSLMQVLSLDRSIALEVRMLRKELLAMFEIREFSEKGRFKNPSASLIVRQVVCNDCNLVRDIDLCRDEDNHATDESEQESGVRWRCLGCEAFYPEVAIQERLVADVEALTLAWTTQDLKCSKCARLRVNDFMEHCACAGSWVGTMNEIEVRESLKTYQRVGERLGWGMLANTVGDLGQEIEAAA